MNTSFIDLRPTILEMAYRCQCLRADWVRFRLELDVKVHANAENIRAKKAKLEALKKWVQTQKIYPHMTKAEKARFQKNLSQWSNRDLTDCRIIHEELGALVWGCGIGNKMPSYEKPFGVNDPAEEFPPLLDASAWAACVGQRSYIDLVRERQKTLIYFFRITHLAMIRDREIDQKEYDKSIAYLVRIVRKYNLDIEICNEDFLYKGRPFNSVDTKEIERGIDSLTSRLTALSWLLGDCPDWDKALMDAVLKAPVWIEELGC